MVACALCASANVRADALDNVRQRGVLIWGGDQEGGGPYIVPDPADPSRVIGFEVELASLFAADLGVTPQFKQGDWNTLPEILRAGVVDVIMNGYEWTPERAGRMAATRPYYIYEMQLLACGDDASISDWSDLERKPHGRTPQIAVLRGTAAANHVRTRFGDRADMVEYDGTTDAMSQVRNGLHEATLTDWVAAIYYRDHPSGRGLKFIGPPVEPGYYVLFAKQGETRLVAAMNATIDKAFRDGRLRAMYERHHIWNKTQERLLDAAPGQATTVRPSAIEIVSIYGPVMLKAAGMTVLLSVSAMPIAVLLGLFVALGRLYGPAPLRIALAAYVEVLRGTPVMLQLYVLYFLLPEISPFALSPLVAAIAGLSINYSAYEAEIYRAGLQAIPRGQMEAALALGMSRTTALRRVIVPQAVRIVIPPVTNDFIALFKDTSVCSVITITELTKQYNVMANSTGAILPLAIMTALLYMAMSYPLSIVTRRLETTMAGTTHGGHA